MNTATGLTGTTLTDLHAAATAWIDRNFGDPTVRETASSLATLVEEVTETIVELEAGNDPDATGRELAESLIGVCAVAGFYRLDPFTRLRDETRLPVDVPTVRAMQAWVSASVGPFDEPSAMFAHWLRVFEARNHTAALIAGLAGTVGRVARAVGKIVDGIRGTRDEWLTELDRALADLTVGLLIAADITGIDLDDAVVARAAVVFAHDWTRDRIGHGMSGQGVA